MIEKGAVTKRESEIHETLIDIKTKTDEKILLNTKLLDNEGYFSQQLIQLVIGAFDRIKVSLDSDSAKFINSLLVREYVSEYQGIA